MINALFIMGNVGLIERALSGNPSDSDAFEDQQEFHQDD